MKIKILPPLLLLFIFTISLNAETFVVNSTGDGIDANIGNNFCETAIPGECTLRAAIEQANFTAGSDTINFNIAGAGVKTITPLSALPDITQTVTINGYSQPGTSPNTLSVGNDAVLLIEINGGGQNADLFHFFADNNVIRGLVINRAPFDGIFLGNPNGIPTTGNIVEGNFIGTDPTGTIAMGNGRFGVSLYFYPSSNNLIGGATPASRNLISGNGQGGIVIGSVGSANNTIIGNYVGTTASGIAAIPNGVRGVFVGAGATNNTIGGAATERNVISGNSGTGVELYGSGLTNNDVRGNFIGVGADGSGSLGNFGYGINVVETAAGNTILSNRIFANQSTGINLGAGDVTPNDAGDADTGANDLQNFPVIASAVKIGGDIMIQGTLNSTPNMNGFVVEFFANASCDSSGYGEGQRLLGSMTVNTDNSGSSALNQTFTAATAAGEAVTATATDPNGNTSEFSQCRTVSGTVQTFTVTNTNDSGAGSLRQAITNANANNLATDIIAFSIAGAGVHTINPDSALPDITDPVIIDGYTQPGASVNTAATIDNAVILIELDGTNAGDGADGLRIVGSGSIVRGLAVNRFSHNGITLIGASGAGDNITISGNFIGTDAAGAVNFGNGNDGIGTENGFGSGSDNNLIGGTTLAARNIISGNGNAGILFDFQGGINNVVQGNFVGLAADGTTVLANNGDGISFGSFTVGTIIGGDDDDDGAADGNVLARNYISGNAGSGIFIGNPAAISGNYIGTDTSGTFARPNNVGISANIGSNSLIGGTTAGAGNLISGNTGDGISVGNTGNVNIKRNFIGTAADGVSALANSGDGIEIASGGSDNQIGGTDANDGNIIAFNGGSGVQITDSGVAPINNPILGNAIYSNGGLGINLSVDAVTPNDAGDADTGANNLQNYPVITTAQPGSTRIAGTLNSTANTMFRLEFFNSPTADSSGSGEGQFFVGALNVMTDGGGNASFDQTFAPNSPLNSYISATATNLTTLDTSEFSIAKQVLDPSAAAVTIGGRVLTATGRGISGARISLTDSNGFIRWAISNSFGYYRFTEVAAGETYVLSARHKSSRFDSQIVAVNENLNTVNFVASEIGNR